MNRIMICTDSFGRDPETFKDLIVKAANIEGISMSAFLVEAGEKEAKRVIRAANKEPTDYVVGE